ncbi:MAG: hypothetical protein LBD92_04805 [Oscillospiraceae bacterium]|nr:hypothetical protein [Oscillospiraceae bacterium]
MKIRLLIAAGDRDYVDHLSETLSERYAETFEVTVCSSAELLEGLLRARTFDVVLLEPAFMPPDGLSGKTRLPLLLWDETESGEDGGGYETIRKYQRVSKLSGDILERYSATAAGAMSAVGGRAKITVVWSPCGGAGKTTVALAYAAQKAVGDGRVTYLDLEYFSSAPVYFSESGKSISTAFEKLGGGAALLLKAIALKDSGSGIFYFSPPSNYDDMNELTADDVEALIAAAADSPGELVIDLPGVCDERCRRVLELADAVYLVVDGSKAAGVKLEQFVTQHNLFERIRSKTALVANRGAKVTDGRFDRVVYLPPAPEGDPVSVYKTLSGVSFE